MHMICRSLRLSTCGGRRTIERSEGSHCNYHSKRHASDHFQSLLTGSVIQILCPFVCRNEHEPYKEPTSMSEPKDQTIALADSTSASRAARCVTAEAESVGTGRGRG